MKLSLRKPPSTRYIHYNEPNQEPPEHIKSKDRIRHILYNFGYIIITNTNDKHLEFKLPPIVTDFIAETEEERIREYQIDLLMYNALYSMMIAVEIHGPYHFASRDAIRKTKMKHRTILEYMASHDAIILRKAKRTYTYPYESYRVVEFTTDEGYGRLSLDRMQIIDRIFNEKN